MKQLLVILILALSMILAFAQEQIRASTKAQNSKAKSEETLPSIDAIIKKSIDAIGGEKAVRKISSAELKGTASINVLNVPGTVESYFMAPNKIASVITWSGFGKTIFVSNGIKGWFAAAPKKPYEVSAIELSRSLRTANLSVYGALNIKALYTKLEVIRKDRLEKGDVYIVEAMPPEGGVERFYFSIKSGLCIRRDFEINDREYGRTQITQYVDEFREFEGIMFGSAIREIYVSVALGRAAGSKYEMKINVTEVKLNAEIDESKFTKPTS